VDRLEELPSLQEFLGFQNSEVLDRIAEVKGMIEATPDTSVQAGLDKDFLANLEEAESEMCGCMGLDQHGPVWAKTVRERKAKIPGAKAKLGRKYPRQTYAGFRHRRLPEQVGRPMTMKFCVIHQTVTTLEAVVARVKDVNVQVSSTSATLGVADVDDAAKGIDVLGLQADGLADPQGRQHRSGRRTRCTWPRGRT